MLAYFTMLTPRPPSVGDFYLEHAYSEGGGTNVVNVILVDFRAFDTMGEILVLAIVALTIFALLRRFRPAEDSAALPYQQREQDELDTVQRDREVGETLKDYLLVPSTIMRWMFPVIVLLAAYLFVRGHDLPGGGFAAGVTMAIGFLVQYLAGGTRWVEERLRILPIRWIGAGLLCAALTGAGSFLFGYPFLTSYFQYTEIPFIGRAPTATALLFDLGVFGLVVGATVLMLVAIAHQSLRVRSRPSRNASDGAAG
jgi:multicomponent K+:H+ antiporter subunit A